MTVVLDFAAVLQVAASPVAHGQRGTQRALWHAGLTGGTPVASCSLLLSNAPAGLCPSVTLCWFSFIHRLRVLVQRQTCVLPAAVVRCVSGEPSPSRPSARLVVK